MQGRRDPGVALGRALLLSGRVQGSHSIPEVDGEWYPPSAKYWMYLSFLKAGWVHREVRAPLHLPNPEEKR